MTLSVSNIVEIAGLVGTLLVGGMKFGAVETRVSALEARKDNSEDVATIKAQVQDIQSDVHDIKRLLQKR